ncbi:MAG: hypothetical protein JKY88_09030 [Pseudomonadales bacterium]|nr:hypothetical protein [Pseudomonadales bacterium]
MGRSISPLSNLGVMPILTPVSLGAALFAEAQTGNRLEGYSGDGDYIELPSSAADTIEYFNSAGSSQWTVSQANVHANIDDWVGFLFDASLIYLVGVDEGTTPNTYYTASINSAGTIVNIGNAQPSSDFTTAAAAWWTNTIVTNGSSLIQRAAVGSGNIFVRQTNGAGMEEMEINISTGAIASDPAVVNADLQFTGWKTSNGLYITQQNVETFYMAGSAGFFSFTTDPAVADLVGRFQIGTKATQWKSNVVFVKNDSAVSSSSPRFFSIGVFDPWAEALYKTGGYAP